MYSIFRWVCISFLFCYGFSTGFAADSKQKTENEIQVLIDVSGSMKQNDPGNLRIPAVKLLINLLPYGSKVGIWTFAQETEVLVKTGIVDKTWKKNALSRITKIHSRGWFTNIEKAIQTSVQNWLDSTENQQRNLILLTDGMVDISKDIMLSAESRERILSEQIPLLQQAGIKVQAIALSDNVDASLFDKLAFDTDGWSETAQSADQLQRVFFRMFKKAVPQDTVPLNGNAFKVDNAINEFTVLVFKQKNAPATQLIAPDNSIIDSKSAINVSWLNESSYDLITIKKPMAGEWKIRAEVDPDNQVMIITDLKFQVDPIANHISENETFDLTAFFTDKEALISRDDFLNLIEISIETENQLGEQNQVKMQAVLGKPGLFSQTLGSTLSKGKYQIKITATSKTFQRENTQMIEVVGSLVKIETDVNQEKGIVSLTLSADETVLDTEMMSIQAIISQIEKPSETIDIEKIKGQWRLEIKKPEEGKSKIVNFSIMAKTLQGLAISTNIKPVIVDSSLFSKSETKIEPEPVDAPSATLPIEKETIEAIQTDEKEPVNWMKTSLIVVLINLILFTAGFFIFKWMKKTAAEKQHQLLERLA